MKLTNNQIDAVVSEIQNQENERYKAQAAKLKNEMKAKVTSKAKEYMKMWDKIPADLKKMMYHNTSLTENKINELLVDNQMKEQPSISRQTIWNKVVLASIDSTTLDELKNKLKFS